MTTPFSMPPTDQLSSPTNHTGATLNRAVIDALPDPIFLKDSSGVYLHCNAAFEEFADATLR